MDVVQKVFEGWEKCLILWNLICFLDQQEDWEMTSCVVYKQARREKVVTKGSLIYWTVV